MNHYSKITLAAALILTAGSVRAADLKLGQQLPLTQVKSLTQQVLTVGKSTLRVIGVTKEGTMVANEIGVVGLSRNEVLVSGVKPQQVKEAAQRLGLKTETAGYYDSTGLSSLRFASIGDAAQARTLLRSALSGASVSLPVQYAEVKSR